jgi:hypothetical protein
MTQKTLILGLGGTGLSTIREIRRLLAERFEAGLDAPEVGSLKFLYIDTDEGDVAQHSWTVLGKKIHLKPSECVYITGDKLKPVVDTPENFPAINAWLPQVKDFIGNPGNGAKGIRPYGRLIYESADNKSRVRDACTDTYNALDRDFSHLRDWRIYLIAGLSGGTGSGMALPLSFDLVRWHLHAKGVKTQKFYSYFVLPPLQISNRHARYHQNAYAYLRELNYYAFQKADDALPYTNCYLVEPRNANGQSIGLENIPLLIAQRIFLNIQGGVAASVADSIMDNVDQSATGLDGGDPSRRHATCFSTFGLSSVSYPRETVVQCLAWQQAGAVVRSWLQPRDYPKNIHQAVSADLNGLLLSAAHVWGDADSFGKKDHPPHEIEIGNMVDQDLHGLSKKQLGGSADKLRQHIEDGFRELGIQGFFKQKVDNCGGAVSQASQLVRYRLTALLRSPQHGLQFAREYLRELVAILSVLKEEVATKSASSTEKRLRTLQGNLSDTVNQTRSNEQKILYTANAFEKDRANLGDDLKAYLKLLSTGEAAKYASKFLDLAIPQAQALANELALWEVRLTEARDAIDAQLKKMLDDLAKGTRENGKVIFDQRSLDGLLAGAMPSAILTAVEDSLRQKLGQEQLDLLSLGMRESQFVVPAIYESSYQWALSPACPVDVRKITLYSKFVEAFPLPEQRQEILKQAEALSAPFLHFSPEQVNIGGVQPGDSRVTVVPNDPGKTVGVETTQSLVQKDLEAIQRRQGQPSDDAERIVFLQERQVFPLRYIEILRELKKMYEEYPRPEALHIDKRITPELFELYALTADQRNQTLEAEEVFLLARIHGWLVAVVNKKSEEDEIRYEYREPGLIGTFSVLFGKSWRVAWDRFVRDASASAVEDEKVRKARLRLTDQARQLRRLLAGDAQARRELASRFDMFLTEAAESSADGIYDPQYVRDQVIVNRILAGSPESAKEVAG